MFISGKGPTCQETEIAALTRKCEAGYVSPLTPNPLASPPGRTQLPSPPRSVATSTFQCHTHKYEYTNMQIYTEIHLHKTHTQTQIYIQIQIYKKHRHTYKYKYTKLIHTNIHTYIRGRTINFAN